MNTLWQPKGDHLNILPAIILITLGVPLSSAITAPVSARPVGGIIQPNIFIVSPQSPPAATYIYGSPVPTPILVDPSTGQLPGSNYYSAPVTNYPPGVTYYSAPVTNYPPGVTYYSYPTNSQLPSYNNYNNYSAPVLNGSPFAPMIVNHPRHQIRQFER